MPGHFENIIIPFATNLLDDHNINQTHIISSETQAQAILNKLTSLASQGYIKVGITYSANHQQTEAIRACYTGPGPYLTDTNGSNQADVIEALEDLINTPEHEYLQNIFRILPITTCSYTATGRKPTTNEWLYEDLRAIETFLKHDGNVVLGWQNQITNGNHYPIGGGVVKLSQPHHHFIQECLSTLHKHYQLSPQPKTHSAKLFATNAQGYSILTDSDSIVDALKARFLPPENDSGCCPSICSIQ
jgi:hypothetical protein